MRGRIHSVSLKLSKKFIWDWDTHSTPAFSPRLALILPVALFVALAAVSCGSSGNPPQGQFPVANAGGPYFTNVGQALAFDGSQSTAPSGQSLSYAWDFGDGGTATGAKPSHTFANPGIFDVKLTVTDTAGATNSSIVPVEVVPLPVSNPGGPYTGKVNVAVTFNGSASTVPPGQTPGYSWNFGDNSTGTGAMPTHTYSTTGTFTVTLSVKDDTGGVGTNSTTATISAGPNPDPQNATTFLVVAPGHPGFAYTAGTSNEGGYLITANTADDSDAALSPIEVMDLASLRRSSGFDLRGMALDPLSRFLYVYSNNSVVSFSIDGASGLLTLKGTTNLNGNISGVSGDLIAFHPSGRFAYVPTQNPNQLDPFHANTISVYEVDSNSGGFNFIESISAQLQNPSAVLVDATGKYLYISGSESADGSSASTITAFAIDPETGSLSSIPGSLVASSTRLHVNEMVAHPSGRFLYAAGYSLDTSSAALSVFAIDKPTGALTEIGGSPFAVGLAGSSATSLLFDLSGKFAYVLTETPVSQSDVQENIEALTLDAATGVPSTNANITIPTTTPSIPGANGALALFSPAASINTSRASTAQIAAAPNAFLYFVRQGNAGISAFSIDASTGQLSPAPTGISPPVKAPIAASSH
ncbi:MAG TPA: PKD domain-containing protein [Candidatus Acidoferrales bacterium]|nr:PKD domain-containing protein [Candidatus Acidoferrales bacterium]